MRMFQIPLPAGQVRILSQEAYRENLALEDRLGANIVEFFRDTLPSLSQRIKDVFSTITDPALTEEARALEKALVVVKDNHLHDRYSEYRSVMVPTVEGLNTDLLSFVSFLNETVPVMTKLTNDLFGRYNFVLAAFISNKDQQTALQDHTALYEKIREERMKLQKGLEAFYRPGNRDRARLGDVLHRVTDLKPLTEQVGTLERHIRDKHLHEVKRLTEKTTSMLDALYSQLQNKDVANVSGQAAQNISEGVWEVAAFVEHLVIFYYAANSALGAVRALREKVTTLK